MSIYVIMFTIVYFFENVIMYQYHLCMVGNIQFFKIKISINNALAVKKTKTLSIQVTNMLNLEKQISYYKSRPLP